VGDDPEKAEYCCTGRQKNLLRSLLLQIEAVQGFLGNLPIELQRVEDIA
jgi:hypothetical protein